ncbi:MAG: DUF4249 domain-containing protein [Bacteroidales bacterium]|nr:DUF4249 domain-containing protein [Bacteroidales bacterium]
MKNKLICLISALSLALAACENVIDEIDLSNDRQIAIMGILNTAQNPNKLYCYYMDGYKISPMVDAQVNVYINGQLSESVNKYEGTNDDMYDLVYYPIKSNFSPGDKVRLEVSSASAGSSVWAETEVPMPVEVAGFDTLRVITSLYNKEASEYYKIALKMKTSADYPVNCRLMAGFQIDEIGGIASADYHTYEKLIDYPDSITSCKNVSLEVREDPALTDGKGYVPVEGDDLITMDTYYYNHYRMVGSQYFNSGAYNVSFYVEPMEWYGTPIWNSYSLYNGGQEWLMNRKYVELYDYLDDDGDYDDYNDEEESPDLIYKPRIILYEKDHNEYLYYQIFAMTDDEYMYLHARSNQHDLNWDESPFVEPVVLKGNINGGLGIFAIETLTEGTIKLLNPIRVQAGGDSYIYDN